jgi:hypothetical protein
VAANPALKRGMWLGRPVFDFPGVLVPWRFQAAVIRDSPLFISSVLSVFSVAD